jgi:hypothetical protein
MAVKRLYCLERQMSKDPKLFKDINTKIQDNIIKGYARKLTAEEACMHSPSTWYLPIFSVKNPHKPEKIRIVYDAAAKVNGVSLNDSLLTGPDLLKSIVGVLWRAREGKIVVAGDIKEMFHRVLIRKEDQNSQRFLWRFGDSSKTVDTYAMNVMTVGAACSPCSAHYVKNENAKQFVKKYLRAVDSILNQHYVDDMLDSFANEEEAWKTICEVTKIHKMAGMEICNWVSNSTNIMSSLSGKAANSNEIALSTQDGNLDKILGLYWNLQTDSYTFKINFVKVDPEIVVLKRRPTKREVLKVVMAIFDPHGYASPILVHAKILMQKNMVQRH